ncbi:Double-stranded RNA-specific editase 1, partial [Papilio machaon]
AICGRIENYISSLPPPYRLQRLKLARAASTEARTATKAPSISICWCCTSQMPEVINATTGKLDSGQPSLLCKQSMFARWQYLITKLPLLPQETDEGPKEIKPPADLTNMQYFEAKQICTTYQAAKERLTIAFEKANLGRWIKKPMEQDYFVCDIVNPDPRALFA